MEVIMKRLITLHVALLLGFLILSCSGSLDGPVVPGSDPSPNLVTGQETGSAYNSTHLWGLWDVFVDPENGKVDAVPLRGIAFACNVAGYVDGPPSNLLFQNLTIDIQVDYTDIALDVGLQHPFPGLDTYTGFDVLGVFMGEGTDVCPGAGGYAVAGEDDQRLLNPECYTRWFNATEFSDTGMPLLGYSPGKSGTPGYTPSAVLNPCKYFADGLDNEADAYEFLVNNADDRGCFKPGSVNFRHYDLRFPLSTGIKFQYAVIAHWEDSGMQGPLPDDFPPSANAIEALVIDIEDSSTAYYVDETNFGGNVVLDISLPIYGHDYPVTDPDLMNIKCYSDAWTGEFAVDMTPVGGGDHYSTWCADIAVEGLDSIDPLPVWIEFNYPELDYSNELGIVNDAAGSLAGYFLYEVPINDSLPMWIEVLTPNGGEEWVPGDDEEITWNSSGVAGTVFIEYSNDNFVSDVNTIATDEVNDESYMWTVPCVISDTLRVRVNSTDNPSVNDTSDDDFSTVTSGWAETWGAANADRGYGIAVDSVGNSYITGYNETSWNVGDVFLRRYNACGELLWEKTWGSSGDDRGYGVAVDDSGNVYATGRFSGTVDFDPDGGTENHISNGGPDIYLSKFEPSGAFQWAKTWGGTSYYGDEGWDVTVDDSGNILVIGNFVGSNVDFDPDGGTEYHSSNGGKDHCLSKFDSSGAFQWAKTWGGGSDEGWYTGIDTDSSGNVFVAGYFHGTNVDFDPGPPSETHSSQGRDVFVSKFDTNGDFQWVAVWGGVSSFDEAYGVTVDSQGYVYSTGRWEYTIDFDPGAPTDYKTSNGHFDVFVSKLDSDGNYLGVIVFGGSSYEIGNKLATDESDNLYLIGYFRGTNVDFDPGAGTDPRSSHDDGGYPGTDVFMSKFNSSGEFQWARNWGPSNSSDGYDIDIDGSGNIYACGAFRTTVDFAPPDTPCNEDPDGHTSNGSIDAFVARYLPNGCW